MHTETYGPSDVLQYWILFNTKNRVVFHFYFFSICRSFADKVKKKKKTMNLRRINEILNVFEDVIMKTTGCILTFTLVKHCLLLALVGG